MDVINNSPIKKVRLRTPLEVIEVMEANRESLSNNFLNIFNKRTACK